MADIPDRTAREERLLAAIESVIAPARASLRRGESVDWSGVETRLLPPITDELAATFAVMLLLWWDDDPLGRLTSFQRPADSSVGTVAVGYASRRAAAIARALADTGREVQSTYRGQPIPPDASSGIDPGRSKTIAVTETTAAGTTGEEVGRRDIETRTATRYEGLWVTAGDDRVCPVCLPLDGLDEPAWRRAQPTGPPIHPNCRCYILWRPIP